MLLIVGPLFTREAVTAPRRLRFQFARCGFQFILFVLVWAAWHQLLGGQQSVNLGEVARFGFLLFQILAIVQLVTLLFLAPLSVAGSVAQEKDRRTLDLLLMSDLTNRELVLGKLLSGLLPSGTMLVGALPLFGLCVLLGGVGWSQVLATFMMTGAFTLALGSVGVVIALWREKTFQTLALVLLLVVLYLVLVESLPALLAAPALASDPGAQWFSVLSPRAALLSVLESDPLDPGGYGMPIAGHVSMGFTLVMLCFALVLNGIAIARVRKWNPSGEKGTLREEPVSPLPGSAELSEAASAAPSIARPGSEPAPFSAADSLQESAQASTVAHLLKGRRAGATTARTPSRHVWTNPIIWREIRTRAYGRRPILIKACYVLLFALMCFYAMKIGAADSRARLLPVPALSLVVVGVVSLLLVNAQAATSVSGERDSRALELLLVTDITPKEFVYGKLGGAFYNCKEQLILPLGMAGFFWWTGRIPMEILAYLVLGLLVLYGFAAMLGVHSGLTFSNSRISIANSLGIVFFLFVGIFVCINLIVAAGPDFQRAIWSFLAFILGGGVGLFASMGAKNPSRAIFWAAMACPFLTFYAIISYHKDYTLGVILVIGAAYGWAIVAMLVPAIHEFDVALEHATPEEA